MFMGYLKTHEFLMFSLLLKISVDAPKKILSSFLEESFLLSILLDCGLILYFPTLTPIGLDEISFFSVLCARVNILCKHVQMCVCVCVCVCMLRHIREHGKWDGRHETWRCHQSLGNYEVLIGHLCLLVLLS
jgi:hypothetical protein